MNSRLCCSGGEGAHDHTGEGDPAPARLTAIMRDAYLKDSAAGNRFDADSSFVIADDALDDIEAEAGTFADGLGGEEGFEDAPLHIQGDSGAIVADLDEHSIGFGAGFDG